MVTGADGGPVGDAGFGNATVDMYLAAPCPHRGAVGGCDIGGSATWFYAGYLARRDVPHAVT